MTNADRCERCGARYALVGRVHNCRPVSRGGVESRHADADGNQASAQQPEWPDQRLTPKAKAAGVAPGPRESETYKYRDPDKWRAYMREYMRTKRGKAKLQREVGASR